MAGAGRGPDVRPDAGSLPLLRELHRRVFADPTVRATLNAAFAELAGELRERTEPPHASRVIPLDPFTRGLPAELAAEVQLCRAFLLRRGCRMGTPEVHRNSVQRLVSYRGRGRIHSEAGGGGGTPKATTESGRRRRRDPRRERRDPRRGPLALVPRAIRSPDTEAVRATPIERCWDIVPAGTWHYPEAEAGADWATVTFHSASESEILDELWENE